MEKRERMSGKTAKPVLYVIVNNHFDPTWRRCWDRRFTFKGQTYASYADLESYYILDNLALAHKHKTYAFEVESSIVLRKFLERHPEKRAALVRLAQEGRFAVTGGGEAIIDGNMVLGESLVRNYLVGLLWAEDVLGRKTQLAVRTDAFGNSAQLPQILRGCELAWATGMSYTPAQGLYWQGLDGSTILHATLPIAAWGGGNTKYAPCPICRGTGRSGDVDTACPHCAGRGIEPEKRAWLPRDVHKDALEAFNAGLVRMAPEELLPNPDLIDWVKEQRETYDARFALEEDIICHLQPWLDNVDAPKPQDVHPEVELNPNNSGCWVTRIKTKQVCRRQEYALLTAEALSTLASLRGASYPRADLNRVWQALFFTMFHDAITATHVDPAYAEIQDFWAAIDTETGNVQASALRALIQPQPGRISVLNLTGHPTSQISTLTLPRQDTTLVLTDEAGQQVPLVNARQINAEQTEVSFVAENVPAFSNRFYQVERGNADMSLVTPLEQPIIENERFRIAADERGISTVFDKDLGVDILKASTYRPGELILEHDEGSPWATLHPNQSRTPLADMTELVAAEKGAGFERLVFKINARYGQGFAGNCLNARVTVTLTQSIGRVDFSMDANWDAFNHRLRVAMPVPYAGQHIYEIPYGMLERTSYEPTFGWAGANGDWPAINWAGVQTDALSIALFNKGLPSYRMEQDGLGNEVIYLSLLRSPTIPTYLHEPQFYTMTDWDGMRDAGDHHFEYAIAAYAKPFAESKVVLDAESYNTGLVAVAGNVQLPKLPRVHSTCTRIASLKWAELGQAIILRLHEFRGQGGPVKITLPDIISNITRVNLLERQGTPLELKNNCVQLTTRPWEITTLRLEL